MPRSRREANPTEVALFEMLRTMVAELRWPDGRELTAAEAYWLARWAPRVVAVLGR